MSDYYTIASRINSVEDPKNNIEPGAPSTIGSENKISPAPVKPDGIVGLLIGNNLVSIVLTRLMQAKSRN